MAVAFANNWDIILSKLESLFRTEFKGALKVYSGLQNEMEGNQYLRLSPVSSSLVDYSTTLETREFSIGMVLYFKEPNIKKTGTDNVMRLVSRIETIIANNNSITLPDGSIAYDCKIESSDIEASDSEYLVQFNLKCTHANSIAFPTIKITAAEVLDGGSSEDSTLSLTFKTNFITTNFLTGDVSVSGGSLGTISGSGTTYTATFTPVSGGAKTIQVLAGKFTDYSGNKNIASDVFNWTYTERFISTWTLSGADTITLPLVSGGSYNFDIDWGDGGATETITAYDQSEVTHSYTSGGVKTITIGGTNSTITGWKFNNTGDKTLITTISNWGTLNISTNSAFYGCTNLNVTATNAPTISSTELDSTWRLCAALTSIGGDWDVSSVQTFDDMFRECDIFNQDIGNWNTGSATAMDGMFLLAPDFNQDIGSWTMTGVERAPSMFSGATDFDQDISSWNVSGMVNMSNMFKNASSFNQDISGWDISSVTNITSLFYGATSFNNGEDPGESSTPLDWDTSGVTANSMGGVFRSATAFNQDISEWDTSKVTSMSSMFFNAEKFNQAIPTSGSKWDVSKVENMQQMFRGADVFNQALSTWNTGSVTNMIQMFRDASAYVGTGVDSWDIDDVTTMSDMFNGANALTDANYNALLIAWNARAGHENNVVFHAGDADPDASGITARGELVGDGWTITDNDGIHT